MGKFIIREWNAPAYDQKSARKFNAGESRRWHVEASTRKDADAVAAHHASGGRARTIVTWTARMGVWPQAKAITS